MNKEELQQRIENMKFELRELEELLEEKQAPKMFPQEGDDFWYFNNRYPFNICKIKASQSNGRLLAYRTKEEAERARDIEVAKMKLRHFIEVANDGWFPDWDDDSQSKYAFWKWAKTIGVDPYNTLKIKPNWMYMKSREIAEDILAKHRDLVEIVESE